MRCPTVVDRCVQRSHEVEQESHGHRCRAHVRRAEIAYDALDGAICGVTTGRIARCRRSVSPFVLQSGR
jgi:hypothetical protein